MLNTPPTHGGKSLVYSWIYRAKDGTPLGVVARYEDKDGKKETPPFFNRNGERWTAGISLNPRPLFGLERLALHPQNKAIFIVEGEKCAAALQSIGCCAITSIGGANAANKADWSSLNGYERIIILPDNDTQGLKYAQDVAALLSNLDHPPTLEIKFLEGLSAKGDIVDWLKQHVPQWDEYQPIDASRAEDLKLKLNEALKAAKIAEIAEIATSAWPEPKEISTTIMAEPFPIDALPLAICLAVEEVAAFSKAPIALVASSALAAVSLAVQAHSDVKRGNRLTGPSSLFFLTVAVSGERKSTVGGDFFASIYAFEDEQQEKNKPLQEQYNAALAAWEAKCSGIKEKIKYLAKENKPTHQQEQQLNRLSQEKPIPPKIPKLIYADFTPEALALSLARQWPSAGIISSEAGTVFGSHGMSADSIMRNLSLLDQIWSGESVDVIRKTSESYTLKNVRLTTCLQVQPKTLQRFFKQSGDLARDIGFLARCLFSFPESTQGTRFYKERPENAPHLDAFNRQIAYILNLPTPLNEAKELSPAMTVFSSDAKQSWVTYHDTVEAMLGKNGELHNIQDVASKSADNAARLACLFQVFEYKLNTEICLDSIERGCKIAAWYLYESRRFLSPAQSQLEENAQELDNWLIKYCLKNGCNVVKKTVVMQSGPDVTSKVKELDPCIVFLEKLGRVRLIQEKNCMCVQINPALCRGVRQ